MGGVVQSRSAASMFPSPSLSKPSLQLPLPGGPSTGGAQPGSAASISVSPSLSARSPQVGSPKGPSPTWQPGWMPTTMQAPDPLQPSMVHTSPSPVHGVGGGSKKHDAEQQSPFSVLPSSHCSPPCWMPSPHSMRLPVKDPVALPGASHAYVPISPSGGPLDAMP